MANTHITAALRCSKFKGTTRLVLLVLADAASPGAKSKDDKKILPFGYCKRRTSTIMALVNCKRQPTVSAAISELKEAGTIKQWLKKKDGTWQVPLYFVDLDWLKANAYTDGDLEQFGYTDKRKATNGEETSHDPHEGSTGVQDSVKEQRKPYNGEHENRLTVDTKTVRADYENRLTDFPPCSTAGAGVFPPTAVGMFPTASRDKARLQDISLRSDEQHQEQGQPQEQHPSLSTVKVEIPIPVHSQAAQLREIPARPALRHVWPPYQERTGETICLRSRCEVTYDDWRYLKDECQGED